MKKFLLSLCVLGLALPPVVSPGAAQAQDEEFEEEDRRSSRRGRGTRQNQQAREVVHGFYVKAAYGTVLWFGDLGANSSPGTCATFELGYDIVDQLGVTVSVTGTFFQGINNGITAHQDEGGSGVTQGDFRSIGGLAGARIGFNPGKRKVRRWTIAIDLKGGVFFSPSLRDDPNDGLAGALQASPGALIQPGLGLEHFSRLTHFSLGLDLHVPLVVGTPANFVAGLDVVGFLKYTF
jgi:hypothetical protein